MKKEISKKYESLSITDIESICIKANGEYLKARKELIETLFYLYATKRFRENPKYKKATFADYLWGMFSVKECHYENERKSFAIYPKQVEKYGIGAVVKVVSQVRVLDQQKVFNGIAAKQAVRKRPLQQVEVDKIISKYIPSKTKPETRSIASYEHENASLKNELKLKNDEIDELKEQNKKLKKTVTKMRNACS